MKRKAERFAEKAAAPVVNEAEMEFPRLETAMAEVERLQRKTHEAFMLLGQAGSLLARVDMTFQAMGYRKERR